MVDDQQKKREEKFAMCRCGTYHFCNPINVQYFFLKYFMEVANFISSLSVFHKRLPLHDREFIP